jgi:hypothetical protein
MQRRLRADVPGSALRDYGNIDGNMLDKRHNQVTTLSQRKPGSLCRMN